MKRILSILAVLFAAIPLFAVQYGNKAEFDCHIGDEGNRTWLRLPKKENTVKALLMAHQNMTEEVLFRSPYFTSKMDSLGVAMAFVQRGSQNWDIASGCQKRFEEMIDSLAAISGHPEMKTCRIIPFGHSAQATFPWNFAASNPDRTLCIISFHGDAPRTNLCGYGRENVEWGRTRNIDRIPAIMIEGEYEWWESRVNPALAFRMMYPDSRISFLCDAEKGHFDFCDETQRYLVRFIEKSLADPRPEGGKLYSRWNPDGKESTDPHDSFWYFDSEMVNLTRDRYKRSRGKKMQYLGCRINGNTVAYDSAQHVKMHHSVSGAEFTVEPFFSGKDRVTPSADHASSRPRVYLVSGPAVQTGEYTFEYDPGYFGRDPKRQWSGITICLEADGDKKYKSAVQEVNIRIPQELTETVPATPHLSLASPDGRTSVSFSKHGKELRYSVISDGKPVILDSRAGLEMDNEIWEKALGKRTLAQPDSWMELLKVDSVSYAAPVDNTWKPLFGERSEIPDRYTGATLHMSRHDDSKYRLDVEIRAYDEGIAFRYFLPEHPDAVFHKVVGDLTDYTFPAGTKAWSEQWAQAPFVCSDVDSIATVVERPLTLLLPSGKWTALLDADVDDWCLTKFRRRNGLKSTLESVMYSPVDVVTYCATPWKIIMVADSPGELIEHNYLVDNLNPAPAKDSDFSWVKPGKIMRCTRLTTEAAIRNIDFCAAHNIPYMLYDWKWYEPCTSHDGDATKVIPAIDMQKVVNYGRKKGVGIWLYVNQHALAKQMDELFPLLHKWGIAGVKSGFVQYASHRWATWLHDMVRKAADNGLMMNIHDEFRPSGFSRTYPNLLTQEGIHGNEEWPDGKHNVTLPFTRMLCGAADYTICYFDKRLKNTHAHQLAASLVYYSPLMTILWYDTPDRYTGEPEIKWFEDLETTFDETKVLSGYPGRNITMARRKGDIWWVGAMTDNNGHHEKISLSFLSPGKKYRAEIYTDGGENVKTATHVACESKIVSSDDTLEFDLLPKGGVAIRIIPD